MYYFVHSDQRIQDDKFSSSQRETHQINIEVLLPHGQRINRETF